MDHQLSYRIAFVLIGLGLLWWQGWRALWCLRPSSLRVELDTPELKVVPDALLASHQTLLRCGFEGLGTHVEAPPLGPTQEVLDYAHRTHGCFASLQLGRDEQPRLMLLTQAERGLALTAGFRRPSLSAPGYVSGVLEQTPPERLVNAHVRRAATLGAPTGALTLEARVELARRWYDGPGRREVRHENAVSLLWSLFALGMVSTPVWLK